MNPVILLEFNELTPSLIDQFIARGHLPNFKRFFDESRTFITEAGEVEPFLEPWIQWVTVHTGVSYRRHRIFHLDQGHAVTLPRVWDVLGDHGYTSWVCGSMNAAARHPTTAIVPDPWSSKVPATPSELNTYFSFVRRQVLDHTNEHAPLGGREYAQFLGYMLTHGFSLRTAAAAVRQLSRERQRDCRWRRVVLLDLLQFDLFAHYYRRLKPAFATFFLNSTAHYQHAYWASMDPAAYNRTAGAEPDLHADAILFGYQQMDRLLGRFFRRFADATLVLSTALSQEPWIDHEQTSGGTFYRPKDIADFVRLSGIKSQYTVAPVMSEQFHIDFRDPAAAEAAERLITASRIGGKPLMHTHRDGARLFAGCAIHDDVGDDTTIVLGGRELRFFEVFYTVPTAKTARHHPDGVLWVRMRDRRHVNGGRTPLTSVAPTLLSLFEICPPGHMEAAALPLGLPGPAARRIA